MWAAGHMGLRPQGIWAGNVEKRLLREQSTKALVLYKITQRKEHRRRREWSLRKPTFEQVKKGGSASGWKEWGKKKIWKIFPGKFSFISSAFKRKNCKSRQTATAKRKDKNKEAPKFHLYSYYSLDCQELLPSKFLLAKGAFYSFTKPIPCLLLGKVHALTNWFGVWPYDNGCEQTWYKCLSRN